MIPEDIFAAAMAALSADNDDDRLDAIIATLLQERRLAKVQAEFVFELLHAGKHLAVKLADTYRAAGLLLSDCQAIRDWMEVVKRAEGGEA